MMMAINVEVFAAFDRDYYILYHAHAENNNEEYGRTAWWRQEECTTTALDP